MIKVYAEMVRDVSWDDEAQRTADTGIIIQEADRLTALVSEILEYSRLPERDRRKDFTRVDLSGIARKVADQFEPLLQQDGGKRERHMGDDKKIIVAVRKDEKIYSEVRDYGEGINEAQLPHIWEKYYTSRQRGNKGASGLGLTFVRQIAEIHGAEYGVESRKGSGSRFWIAMEGQ